jgi:hypothetical protein
MVARSPPQNAFKNDSCERDKKASLIKSNQKITEQVLKSSVQFSLSQNKGDNLNLETMLPLHMGQNSDPDTALAAASIVAPYILTNKIKTDQQNEAGNRDDIPFPRDQLKEAHRAQNTQKQDLLINELTQKLISGHTDYPSDNSDQQNTALIPRKDRKTQSVRQTDPASRIRIRDDHSPTPNKRRLRTASARTTKSLNTVKGPALRGRNIPLSLQLCQTVQLQI